MVAFYILQVVRYFIMTKMLMTGPQKLHELMTYKVIRAKKEFFDRNPSGRILNRFSSDIGHIDTTLIECAKIMIDFGVRPFIMLIIISFISNYLIILCVLIIFCYMKIAERYKKPIARIKQLESVSRSPVYSELSQTISGIIIVRCYRRVSMFLRKFMKKLNNNCKIEYSFHWANRTLGFNLDAVSYSFTFISLAVLIFWQESTSGWIGLGIMSLTNFQGATQYMVRQMLYFD